MSHPPDSAVAVVWLLATGILVASSYALACRLLPGDAARTRAAYAIVIGWAHIVAPATALGACGLLTPAAVLAGVAGSAAVTLLLTRRAARPTRPVTGMSVDESLKRWLWPCAWGALLAVWAGHMVLAGVLRFPDDWDTLMYHLPLVDHWLQARSLYAPDGLRWSDPGNNELVALWLVAPFSGDFLYALTNLPAAALLAAAAAEVGGQVGLGAVWRNLAALAVVTNFVVLKQLTDVENDVAVAALFLAALASAFRYGARGRGADLGLGSVALGLLAGVKFYALGYAAVAAAAAALIAARRQGAWATARAAVVGALAAAVFGGYWYARNWAAGGSPLYPLGAGAERGLGAIYPGSVWETAFLGNRREELLGLTVRAVWGMAGPYHLAAFLGLPFVTAWLVAGGSRRGRCGDARVALALAAAGAAAVWLVTPFAVEDVPGTLNQMHWQYCPVRYGLCFLSLSVIGLSVVLEDLCGRVQVAAAARAGALRSRWAVRAAGAWGVPVLFATGIVYQLTAACQERPWLEVIASLLIGGNVLLAAVHLRYLPVTSRRPQSVGLMVTLLVAIGFSVSVNHLTGRWHRGYAPFYDRILGRGVFRHLGESRPQGSTLCVLDLRGYPFFGSARQFRVCQPPVLPSYPRLEHYLKVNDVRLVAARHSLADDSRGWSASRTWVLERPEVFTPVTGTEQAWSWPYFVYEVRLGLSE